MDIEKSGRFIAAARKSRSLTQKELADIIGVTDKAVSRWETGKGFPDVSLLTPLAKALGVSVTDIINGEAASNKKTADDAVIGALNYAKKMRLKVIGAALLLVGAMLLCAPLFVTGIPSLPLFIAGAVVTTAAVLLIQGGIAMKLAEIIRSLPRRAAGICALTTLAAALVLEVLPCGAVLKFADGPDNTIRETFSYFDLTPFGYANFFPIITALLTVAIAVMAVIIAVGEIRGREHTKLRSAAFICTAIAAAASVLPPVMYGADYLTPVGVFITAALVLSAVLQAFFNRA